MLTEIISIGDELLIGQVVNTNSAWMGQKLNETGILVHQVSSISDNEEHIVRALKEAESRADIILITGGLGPTKDDLTKTTLCKYFNCGLRFDEESFHIIETIFRSRNREITDVNRKQAEVPEACRVLLNHRGTAPGMWFERNGKIFVSMPGVPNEMKGLMERDVLPELKKRFQLTPIVHRTILTQGIGESFLAASISEWENNLPANMKLAYLPAAGMVRLRITARGNDEVALRRSVDEQAKNLYPLINEYIFGEGDETLEIITGRLLREQKFTVCTAESCTGGYIAHRITSVPGSSEYYVGSVVAYDNGVKIDQLGVDFDTIEQNGAVSEPVVIQLATHARNLFKTDYAVSCSGIAGPAGGTPGKPVGTVWIAVASMDGVVTRKLQLGNHRDRVIHETMLYALNMLRKELLKHQEPFL